MGFQIYTKVRRATKTKVDFLYYLIFGWGMFFAIFEKKKKKSSQS